MGNYFAGIDLGTSGCRLIIINSDKNIQSSTHILYKNPDSQTPELWWDSVRQLLADLPAEIKRNLQSLAIDGTSGTVLMVDDNGIPLTSALMYNDSRASKEADQIKAVLPQDNGGQGTSGSLAKVLWLIKNEIKSDSSSISKIQNNQKVGGWQNIAHITHHADFILGRLSNTYSLSDENNCLKLGYDVINQCWPIDALETLGINPSMLPKVVPAGTGVAQIDHALADTLGLPKSLQLVTGTTDSIAAFIATGADKVGDAVTSLGSTLVLKLISDKPIFSPEYGIYSHRLQNKWLVGGASNSGAKVLQHYFTQAQIDQMTEHLSPDNSTQLNYYPLTQTGERFPIADVNKQAILSPRPESDVEFFQGILEGIANIEAQAYQKLLDLGAPKIKSVRSVGGGSKNTTWTQIRKNLLKIDMITPKQTEAAYGSALLALQGVNG